MSNKWMIEKAKLEIRYTLERSNNDSLITHRGVAGSGREEYLAELLEKFINKNYEITGGLIINSSGLQSNETDLIIYNTNILPPMYIDKVHHIVPIESVVYAFEVKTKLTSTELQTTVQKFINLQSMGYTNMTVCFAYNTDIKGNELERYISLDEKFLLNPPIKCLCVVGKGYYFFDCRVIGNSHKYCRWVGIESDGENKEVVCLLAGIGNTLNPLAELGRYLFESGSFDYFYQAIFDENNNLIERSKENRALI